MNLTLTRTSGAALRSSPLLRVKVKITVKNAGNVSPRPLHMAYLTVNSTLTRTSGARKGETEAHRGKVDEAQRILVVVMGNVRKPNVVVSSAEIVASLNALRSGGANGLQDKESTIMDYSSTRVS